MAIKNVALDISMPVWDYSASPPVPVASLVLTTLTVFLRKNDGAWVAHDNANPSSEVQDPGPVDSGYYLIELDADDMNADSIQVKMISTDANHFIAPVTIITEQGKFADIEADTTVIGTAAILDGGNATIGSMLTKMADNNSGVDFNAATDSLHEMSDLVTAIPTTAAPTVENIWDKDLLIGYSGLLADTKAGSYIKTIYGETPRRVWAEDLVNAGQYPPPTGTGVDTAGGILREILDVPDDVWTTTVTNGSVSGNAGGVLADSWENTTTLESRLTSVRASYLDNLNVTGDLANISNADSFKADLSSITNEEVEINVGHSIERFNIRHEGDTTTGTSVDIQTGGEGDSPTLNVHSEYHYVII